MKLQKLIIEYDGAGTNKIKNIPLDKIWDRLISMYNTSLIDEVRDRIVVKVHRQTQWRLLIRFEEESIDIIP